jgi:hypothetical protein
MQLLCCITFYLWPSETEKQVRQSSMLIDRVNEWRAKGIMLHAIYGYEHGWQRSFFLHLYLFSPDEKVQTDD